MMRVEAKNLPTEHQEVRSESEVILSTEELENLKSQLFPGAWSLKEYDDRLDGVCFTLPTGYWTYEICHNQVVKQFHLEHDPTDPGKGAVPTNLISLGTHSGRMIREGPGRKVRKVVTLEEGDISTTLTQPYNIKTQMYFTNSIGDEKNDAKEVGGAIVAVTDYFEDGDVCEPDAGHQAVTRSTTVTSQCCQPQVNHRLFNLAPDDIPSDIWWRLQELVMSDTPYNYGEMLDEVLNLREDSTRTDKLQIKTGNTGRRKDPAIVHEESMIKEVAEIFMREAGESELNYEQAMILASQHVNNLHQAKIALAVEGLEPGLQPASVMRLSELQTYKNELVSRYGQKLSQPGGAAVHKFSLHKVGYIGAFAEISRCQYHFIVCSPSMCHPHLQDEELKMVHDAEKTARKARDEHDKVNGEGYSFGPSAGKRKKEEKRSISSTTDVDTASAQNEWEAEWDLFEAEEDASGPWK